MYDPTVTSPQTREELGIYVALYGFFAALGSLPLLVMFLVFVWPQYRINTTFVESEGVVVDLRDTNNEGGSYRQVCLRYTVQGAEVEHWTRALAWPPGPEEQLQQRIRSLAIGERCPVWYDPASPEDVVIDRSYRIHWMLLPIAIGCGFFLLYGIGKIIVGIRKFAVT